MFCMINSRCANKKSKDLSNPTNLERYSPVTSGYYSPNFVTSWHLSANFRCCSFLAHLITQMCYCYQKLEIWTISGADLSKPVRGSERSHDLGRGSGGDQEQIPSHSCDLSEPIRGSESQSGYPPDPSLEDPLPKVM